MSLLWFSLPLRPQGARTKNKTPVLHPATNAVLTAVNPPPLLCLDRSALLVPSHVLTPCTLDGACQSQLWRLASPPAEEGASAIDSSNEGAFDERMISLRPHRRSLADHRSSHVRPPTGTHHHPIPPPSTDTQVHTKKGVNLRSS